MAESLDEKRREIDARPKELKPLVDEYMRLEAAAALAGVATANASTRARGGGTSHTAAANANARRPGAANGKSRGRPKGTRTRAKEALEIVTASPGITVPQVAEKMGIKQNYLYRVLAALADEGLVSKEGRGWHPEVAA